MDDGPDGLPRSAKSKSATTNTNRITLGPPAMAGTNEPPPAPAAAESDASKPVDGLAPMMATSTAAPGTRAGAFPVSHLPSPLPSPTPLLPASGSMPATPAIPLLPTHDEEEDESSIPSTASSTRPDQSDSSNSSAVSEAPLTPTDERKEPQHMRSHSNSNGSSTRPRGYSTKQAHDNVRRLSAAEMQTLTAAPSSLPIAVVQPADEAASGLDYRSARPVSRRNSALPTPILDPSTPLATPAEGPSVLPLPPMSLPTHLQLELAAQRPSPLYILAPGDLPPYESYAVKFERLKNVLLIPLYLERSLNFGALACLDAWLYTFTILPMRFCIAVGVLVKWWAYLIAKEVRWVVAFVWYGLGRLWTRGRRGRESAAPSEDGGDEGGKERSESRSQSRSQSRPGSRPRGPGSRAISEDAVASRSRHRVSEDGTLSVAQEGMSNGNGHTRFTKPPPVIGFGGMRHRRTKSMPSNLSSFHKADLLQGLVIIFSSMFLMNLDASRMYHFIRAQSAIKLYAIYNLLEVGDRLLSALGQDIFECLFSSETLSRNSSGRSKIILPLGMFVLALTYNIIHSVALYYEVITLNVAVNSYSNALLTLLMSNQFVEIKSTVFKRFEKDNLFQLTCADIVERFQLWVMLLIIGMRNVVEVGGLSVPGAGLMDGSDEPAKSIPLHSASILPHSFTVLPSWLWSGEVLSPFLIVIGSEMLVDIIKHAYVTKFNQIKPTFYSRILDILCKDYYTNAFVTPTLTRRLGLAVIPLSCLFIRASVQTYHMFLSVHVPPPLPESTQTSLSVESATPSSPAMLEALNRIDTLLRDALGRSVYGYPYSGNESLDRPWYSWNSDDVIAAATMIVVFFIIFLVLLIVKLLLGMALLRYSQGRYAEMKQKEQAIAAGKAERESYDAKGQRVGARAEVEVGEERRRWIHADDAEGLKSGRGRGGGKSEKGPEGEYKGVFRYEMVAKRIW